MGIFVGLYIGNGDNLNASQFEIAIEPKYDGVHQRVISGTFSAQGSAGRAGAMINLNIIFVEPVSIEVKGKAAQKDGNPYPYPGVSGHVCKG